MANNQDSILFVCTYWGVRSQIAQLLAKQHAPTGLKIDAAGMESGSIGPLPRDLMEERGLSLAPESPPTIFDRANEAHSYDYVITLCSVNTQEQSSVFLSVVEHLFPPPSQVLHWDVQDFMSLQGEGEARKQAARQIVADLDTRIAEFVATNMT